VQDRRVPRTPHSALAGPLRSCASSTLYWVGQWFCICILQAANQARRQHAAQARARAKSIQKAVLVYNKQPRGGGELTSEQLQEIPGYPPPPDKKPGTLESRKRAGDVDGLTESTQIQIHRSQITRYHRHDQAERRTEEREEGRGFDGGLGPPLDAERCKSLRCFF
jgi:hypothetical protein